MKPVWHSWSPKSALRFSLILAGLTVAFPVVSEAAKVGGGTTTTMVLTYVNGVKKWVCRIDPLNVQGFQLDFQWDPNRVQLDTSVGLGGVIYKNPFNQTSAPILDMAGGFLRDIAGSTLATSPGDVDIFELVFIDLQPGLPIDGVPFTVFASPNDSITAFDPDTNQTVVFDFTQIAPTTRTSTTGVLPHVWDPDTVYNNGNTGGSGTWNTTSSSWDDLPLAPALNDTAWDNTTHANDIAVFGGNPGSGIVTLVGPISAGGFQFDISGYNVQGSIITLSAPAAARPTIDTGANSATISSAMNGSAFTKVGTGTLILPGTSNFAGNVVVAEGTLAVNGSLGSNGLLVDKGALVGNGMVSAPVTIGNDTGSADALIAPGTPDTVGTIQIATLTLRSDAVYEFDLDSTAMSADKIMTFGPIDLSNGLAQLSASDLGSSPLSFGMTFTIVENSSASPTIGFFAGLSEGSTFTVGSNTFQINYGVGAGANDVQITVVPEPGAWAMFLAGAGLLYCIQRFRKKHV